ncbi:hypothetical protein QR90_06830 [Deinococcus radiopugnans]|uniref:Right handed beta helix region n=1 Tax=Deinococcus radiopugnans TaxID=57497 RepID=A0A0A7KFE7_9DEIO|nr:hypothetical protein [Deinococcus radiopugnans]AIZ44882.1 hypothetical protein QR90_06830 [Deinococcus radiopugnans]
MSRLAQLLARIAAARAGLPSPPVDPPRPTILFTGPAGPINASPYLLTVTLSDSSNVARVDFFKGTLQIGQALSAPYTCPAPLTYLDNGEVRFRAVVIDLDGQPREVSFRIDVAIGEPDTTSPVPVLHVSATNFTADGTLTLTCAASDNTGVTSLVLTRTSGGQAPLPLTIAPDGTFSETITRASNGTHVYTLTAFDAAGNPGSTSVTVTVAIPQPAGTLGLSAFPLSLTSPGTVALGAVPSLPSGVTIRYIDFYQGTETPENYIRREGAAPYEATSNLLSAANSGTVKFIAVATDSLGRQLRSEINVAVNITGETPPPAPNPALYVEPDYSSITWEPPLVITDAYLNSLGITPLASGPDAGRYHLDGGPGGRFIRNTVKGDCAIWVNTTRPLLLTRFTASGPAGSGTGRAAIGNGKYGAPLGNSVAVDVIIRDSSVITPGLELLDGQRAGGILFGYAKNVIVENCNLNGTSILAAQSCWGGGTFRAERNRFRNIDGRYRDRSSPNGFSLAGANTGWALVQAVQLDKVRGVPGISIKDNWITNEPGLSRVEDNINTYKSGGTADSPLMIDRNIIDGAYDTVPSNIHSGSAVVMGDEGGEHTTAQRNTAVRTSNTGISMSSMNHGKILDNRIGQTGFAPDGSRVDQNGQNIDVGIYARNYASNFVMDKATNLVGGNLAAWGAPLSGQPNRRLDFGFSSNATEGPTPNTSYAGVVTEALLDGWIADHLALWAAEGVVVGRRVS